MKRHIRKILIILGVFVLVVILSLADGFVSYKPITGVILDSDSELPIEDVVVVALWKLQASKNSITTTGVMKIQEVSTNEEGKYYMPGWFGFKPSFFPIYRQEMHFDTPELYLFKRQYHYGVLINRDYNDSSGGFKWNAQTFKLKKMQESEYKDMLNTLYKKHFFSLMIIEDNECIWHKIPKFINETKYDYFGNEITFENDKKTMTLFEILSERNKRNNCGDFNE